MYNLLLDKIIEKVNLMKHALSFILMLNFEMKNILHISQEVVLASPLSVPQFWSIALHSSFSQAVWLY